MKQTLKAALLAALGFALAGCVSTGKYKKLEGDRNSIQAKYVGLESDYKKLQVDQMALLDEKQQLQKKYDQTKTDYGKVVDDLESEVLSGALQVRQYKNMLTVDVAEQIFFASGSAKLKETGKQVLKKVGEALKAYESKVIRVVGHTDNVPLGKKYQAILPSNWELSVMRATNVVRFLQDEVGIDPIRLVAAGRGEYQPIAPNDTPENRQKNRRIEIMLIDKSLMDEIKSDEATPNEPQQMEMKQQEEMPQDITQ